MPKAVGSFLPLAFRWLAKGTKADPKMLSVWHPLASTVINYIVVLASLILADSHMIYSPLVSPLNIQTCSAKYGVEDVGLCRELGLWKFSAKTASLRGAAAFFLVTYWAFLIFGRTLLLGSYNLYDSLWGCNSGLIVVAYSLVANRPLMAAATVFVLSIDQVTWWGDVLCYIIYGKFKLGVAEYLTWPETHWFKKLTCGHHLWFFPLILAFLKLDPPAAPGFSNFPFLATTLLGIVFEFLIVAPPRFFLPKTAYFPEFSLSSTCSKRNSSNSKKALKLKEYYLNVNLSYEGWKDVSMLPWVFSPKWVPRSRAWRYIPYQNFAWWCINVILCLPFFVLI